MFFKKSIENKIRVKALLIYLVLAIGCGVMIAYVWHLRQNMQEQKQQVSRHYHTLSLTSQILTRVNEAKLAANGQAVGRSRIPFQTRLDSISLMVDSLNKLEQNLLQKEISEEIVGLLSKKATIVRRLNTLFKRSNPIDPIREKLLVAGPALEKDSVQVTTTIQDTLIRQAPPRKFWKRFADLFSPGNTPADTIIQMTTLKADTVMSAQEETRAILTEVTYFAEDAKLNYDRRMRDIERQVQSLLVADQDISTRLSELLIHLYQRSVRSTFLEIEKSENRIQRYYLYLFAGGIGILILILIFIILILQDVNQGRQARRELQKAHDRVQQLMESRHQLLLSVSHDIKTPLNSILGYLELWNVQRYPQLSDITCMQHSGSHILALLENLLEYSALEQGKLTVNRQTVQLLDLCREVGGMFESLCERKGLHFQTACDIPASLRVNTDSLKVKQLLINLLSNAVKYTPAGEIRFSAAYRSGVFRVEIADTGAGIPSEKIATLFRPFERITDNNALAEGTGLGLYVVKGLTDLLEGDIKITSEVNRGTCISLTLPMEEIVGEKDTALKKVLVVDDDPALLVLIGRMLERLGHEAIVCSDRCAFEKILRDQKSSLDCVITDMEMQLFTGKDILSIARRVAPGIPVMVMTARSDYHMTRATELGFDGYLAKPFTLQSLRTEFGGKEIPNYNLSRLDQMFEGDREAVNDVLQVFVETTGSNILQLRQFLDTKDYHQAQAVCHKMLPMFAQLEAEDSVRLLKKIDAARTEAYHGWEDDLQQVIAQAELLKAHLRS